MSCVPYHLSVTVIIATVWLTLVGMGIVAGVTRWCIGLGPKARPIAFGGVAVVWLVAFIIVVSQLHYLPWACVAGSFGITGVMLATVSVVAVGGLLINAIKTDRKQASIAAARPQQLQRPSRVVGVLAIAKELDLTRDIAAIKARARVEEPWLAAERERAERLALDLNVTCPDTIESLFTTNGEAS
jgi:hypothetical protein